jgi:hypothetical protein
VKHTGFDDVYFSSVFHYYRGCYGLDGRTVVNWPKGGLYSKMNKAK